MQPAQTVSSICIPVLFKIWTAFYEVQNSSFQQVSTKDTIGTTDKAHDHDEFWRSTQWRSLWRHRISTACFSCSWASRSVSLSVMSFTVSQPGLGCLSTFLFFLFCFLLQFIASFCFPALMFPATGYLQEKAALEVCSDNHAESPRLDRDKDDPAPVHFSGPG